MGFNEDQINKIILTIKYYEHIEPFTNKQIKEYIQKLNEISQFHSSRFDLFLHHMEEHLEGLHDNTFKQWVDKVYEMQKKQVETDFEYDSDDDDEM